MSETETKTCRKCQQDLPLSKFYADNRRKDGRRGSCKQCEDTNSKDTVSRQRASSVGRYLGRTRHLKAIYGITLEQFDVLFDTQQGVCAICHSEETAKDQRGITRRLSIDHCHKTGEVRGLLCNACNNGIARFNDNPAILAEAIRYLLNNGE